MRLRSCLVTVSCVLVGSALFAGSASAAGLTVTPTILGAGKVEDAGHYTCSASPPSNSTATGCAVSNGYAPDCPFRCILTNVLNLTPTAEPGWRFVGWSGVTPPGCVKSTVCNMSWSVLGTDVVYTPVATFHEIVDLTISGKPAAFERVKT